MDQRVVITGIGILTSIGKNKEEFWESLINSKTGIDYVKSFDTSGLKFNKGSEIKEFCLEDYIDIKRKNLGRSVQLFLACTQMAVKDSKIVIDKNNDEIGISIGTGLGEITTLEAIDQYCWQKRMNEVPSDLFLRYPANNITSEISSFFKIYGSSIIFSTACSSGNDAIAYAYSVIKKNKSKIMVAGGVDSFSKIAYTGFARLNAMAKEVCQPFDKNRQGIIIGEGAGVMILEDYQHAMEREANIYAEIIGYGSSCDAYHITIPDPNQNSGIIIAIEKALINSNINSDKIDYICAHGTGTKANDQVETKAIKKVFGEYARKIPISSVKSMIGHTGGASGPIGAITCSLAIKNGMIPPTANYKNFDEECDLNYVTNGSIKKEVTAALNNSFAFGGSNTSLVLKKV